MDHVKESWRKERRRFLLVQVLIEGAALQLLAAWIAGAVTFETILLCAALGSAVGILRHHLDLGEYISTALALTGLVIVMAAAGHFHFWALVQSPRMVFAAVVIAVWSRIAHRQHTEARAGV